MVVSGTSSYSLACTLMIFVDHSKVVLQNKPTYIDGGNKIHNFESSSNIKENAVYQEWYKAIILAFLVPATANPEKHII